MKTRGKRPVEIAWWMAFALASAGELGLVKAEEKGLGVGVVIGEPTGLTVKKWINEVQAIDVALGWSLVGESPFTYIHMEHLWHSSLFFAGVGVRLKQVSGSAQAGLRIPLGVNLLVRPIEVYGEAVPTVAINSSMALTVNVGFGARVYF